MGAAIDGLWFFFFNDTATTEIYTLSLHDALPISLRACERPRPSDDRNAACPAAKYSSDPPGRGGQDRKSTRLNSSHANISYAVFCLKKKTHPPLFSTTLYSPTPPSSRSRPLLPTS